MCQLKFQQTAIYTVDSGFYPITFIADDFNRDGRLDLAVLVSTPNSVSVLLGNGDGTFEPQKTFLTENVYSWGSLAGGDFNNDSQLDIAFTEVYTGCVGILLGNGDGTFESLPMFSTGNLSVPFGITVADFNRDNFLDIAVANCGNNNVGVFLGNGNGTFAEQTTFSTGPNSWPVSITVGDFNSDDYIDIAVLNRMSRNVGILLGHGNGTFETQKTSFTEGGTYQYYLAVDDFNGDNRLDVVFSYYITGKDGIDVLFGYGNGTLGAKAKFIIGDTGETPPVAVGDFNCDGHSDIVVGNAYPYSIVVLLGYGNGDFKVQTILSTEFEAGSNLVTVGDFNGDGYQDIVAANSYSGAMSMFLNTCECCTSEILKTST